MQVVHHLAHRQRTLVPEYAQYLEFRGPQFVVVLTHDLAYLAAKKKSDNSDSAIRSEYSVESMARDGRISYICRRTAYYSCRRFAISILSRFVEFRGVIHDKPDRMRFLSYWTRRRKDRSSLLKAIRLKRTGTRLTVVNRVPAVV